MADELGLISSLPDWLTWGNVAKFLESNFFSALFAAMAGAYGGARAAQKISERSKLDERLKAEIRACNSAIEVAGGIANTYLTMKRQFIRKFKRDFDEQRTRVVEHWEKIKGGEAQGEFDVGTLNLGTLPPVRVRIGHLEQMLQEKINIAGRPLGCLHFLLKAKENLDEHIGMRNTLVEKFRLLAVKDQVPLMFGLPTDAGVDTTYVDLVNAIAQETDDCIAFSRQLCLDVEAHGKRMHKRYVRRFRKLAPRISSVSFDTPAAKEVIPTLKPYEALLAMYSSRVPATDGRTIAKGIAGVRRALRTLGWSVVGLFTGRRALQ